MALAPSPSDGMIGILQLIEESSTAAADFLTLACFVVFALLIGFDVWRAFGKRAIWLPGNAFALSGVTVQIIVWWTSLSNLENGYEKQFRHLLQRHYIVVSGRVAVCVFVGYLLPGMTAPSVRVFAALAFTICAQIASELVVLYNPIHYRGKYPQEFMEGYVQHRKERITWSRITDATLLICIIVLGLILCCSVLASKTIHGLLKQRISAIAGKNEFQFSNKKLESNSGSTTEEEVSQFSNEEWKPDWDKFGNEVLKSWFAARVCRDDYVISRSCFSSAVWVLVTTCVILFYMSQPLQYHSIISPLTTFIVTGWVIICWIWMVAQLYSCPPRCNWRRWFCMEDFWTSSTVELIDMYDLKREQREFQKSKSKMCRFNKSQSLVTRIFTKVRLHKLLYLVLALQLCVVFFSKVCALLSEVTVGIFVHFCRGFVHFCRYKCIMKEYPDSSYEKYKEILDDLCMPGEDPFALWEANEVSLNKAKRLMKKGYDEGSSSEEINSIINQNSVQYGAQLLSRLKEKALPSVLRHFPSVEKQFLKMAAVSLLLIFIRLHKIKTAGLTKVVKACHAVWDLICFAEECDIDLQADSINLIDDLSRDKNQVLMAADRELYKLQMDYNKLPERCIQKDTMEVRAFLEDLSSECEKILKDENLLEDSNEYSRDLRDSKQWTKIAPRYTLYKLCKLMLDEDIKDHLKWTEESLRNVIAYSMSRLPDMLVKQCWKWAQECEEDKLWEAIQLAGKCKGMMEGWDQTTAEQPSRGEQSLSKKGQCTIEV